MLFSLEWLAAAPLYASLLGDLDLASSRAVDAHTVELALHRPRGDLVEGSLSQVSPVIPAGTTDFTAPVARPKTTPVSKKSRKNPATRAP